MNSGNLNFLERSGPPWASNWTALPLRLLKETVADLNECKFYFLCNFLWDSDSTESQAFLFYIPIENTKRMTQITSPSRVIPLSSGSKPLLFKEIQIKNVNFTNYSNRKKCINFFSHQNYIRVL